MSDDNKVPLSQRPPQMMVDAIWVFMRNNLTSERRLEIMNHFCKDCGDDDPTCQCWNNE